MNQRLRQFKGYALRIYGRFQRHSGGLLAAAISFYGLLSLVPLLSLAVAVLGWILGGSRDALPRLQGLIQESLPSSGQLIYETLSQIKRSSGIAGAIGFGGLLLAASAIFSNLEVAFNNLWGAQTMRGWLRQRLLAFGLATLVLALFAASVGATSTLTWLQNRHLTGTQFDPTDVPLIWHAAGRIVPLALSILMFTLIYRIVPNCDVRWASAVRGGLFAGIAWEAAKIAFTWYAAHFANYNRVYGSLGAVVSLMFWAYYSSTILFIGAEIAADPGPACENPETHPVQAAKPQPIERHEAASRAESLPD